MVKRVMFSAVVLALLVGFFGFSAQVYAGVVPIPREHVLEFAFNLLYPFTATPKAVMNIDGRQLIFASYDDLRIVGDLRGASAGEIAEIAKDAVCNVAHRIVSDTLTFALVWPVRVTLFSSNLGVVGVSEVDYWQCGLRP